MAARKGTKPKEPKGKGGRPSKYSETLADKIINQLIDGKSLREICKPAGMPDKSTVIRWLDDQAFRDRYARAREAQADTMDDLVLETANKTNARNAAANRVKIDAYKWRAGKLKPKVYGDRQMVELDVVDNRADALKAARERAAGR